MELIVDGMKVSHLDVVQFATRNLESGCQLRYKGVVCHVRYPVVEHVKHGLYAIRVSTLFFVKIDAKTVLDAVAGTSVKIPAGLPMGMCVRVRVTGGLRHVVYPRDFVELGMTARDLWPGVDRVVDIPPDTDTRKVAAACADCTGVHASVRLMQPGVELRHLVGEMSLDFETGEKIMKYATFMALGRTGDEDQDDGFGGIYFLACVYVLFRACATGGGGRKLVLVDAMARSRYLVGRYMDLVCEGLVNGRMCVLHILRVYTSQWRVVHEKEWMTMPIWEHLCVGRETMDDVLVEVEWVLGTPLYELVRGGYGGILRLGALYIWTSRLREWFVHQLQKKPHAFETPPQPFMVLADDKLETYTATELLWGRMYGLVGNVVNMFYTTSSAKYERDESSNASRICEFLRWTCVGQTEHLLRLFAGIVRDGLTREIMIDKVEVEARMRFAIQALILRKLVDGPVHDVAIVEPRRGKPGLTVTIRVLKNTRCLSTRLRCIKQGHADAGDMYFVSSTHSSKWPTGIRAYSFSSKHVYKGDDPTQSRAVLAEIQVCSDENGMRMESLKRFNV